VLLPGRPGRGVIVTMSLAKATVLFANAGETTRFAPLVNRLGDPADPGVPSNRLVIRIDKNNLVVLVDTVLVHPV